MTPNLLPPSQARALRLAANGLTAAQIAHQLGTTENGIHCRLRAAAKTLGARSRAHLVALALTRGILAPGDIQDPHA